ncbi:MAG: hypothetical protein ABIA76_05605 [Candidatus Diapherotrites archaeon]
MNKEEVIKKIGKHRWKEFDYFVREQKVGLNKDRSYDYYERDVENFLRPKHRRFWD